MNQPRRIVISGYVGFGNAGDEAILTATLHGLRSLLPGVEILVLSRDPATTARQHAVQAVHRLNPLHALLRCDLVLSGGGGLLQDATSQRSLLYYLGILAAARLLGKRTMVYANSVGPILRKSSARLASWVLNRVDAITVRDSASAEELHRLGVRRPPVKVTADPALLLHPVSRDEGINFLRSRGVDPAQGPIVAVSVRPWKSQRHVEVVAGLADHLVQTRGAQIVFFPVQPVQDEPVLRQVMALMRNPSQLLPGDVGLRGLLALLAAADMAVAMRLHALIFSLVQATPAAGIVYDPKVEHFLQEAGLPALGAASDLSLEQAVGGVDALWRTAPEVRRKLERDRAAWQSRAHENLRQVAGLLAPEGVRA